MKRLSYIQDAQCLKVLNHKFGFNRIKTYLFVRLLIIPYGMERPYSTVWYERMIINSTLGKQVATALTQHIKCGNNVA